MKSSSEKLRIAVLHSGKNVPSARYRSVPLAERLRVAGHQVLCLGSVPAKYTQYWWLGFRFSRLLSHLIRWLHFYLCRLNQCEVILIERELFDEENSRWEQWYRKHFPFVVLDLDDGVFLRYPQKMKTLFELSDLVVVGNSFLEHEVQQSNSETLLIPTCINLNDVDLQISSLKPAQNNSQDDGTIILGWIGTSSNLPYLKVVVDAVNQLSSDREILFRIVTNTDQVDRGMFQGVDVQWVSWKAEDAYWQISQFDIGVMPLPDDQWAKYKCGFKLLQYMACRVASIASPVGVNETIIEHEKNGLLAQTQTEWEQALRRLVQSLELRRQLGAEARRTVESQYQLSGYAQQLEGILLEKTSKFAGRKNAD